MVEASAVDLIRFADEQTSVIVRVLGRLHPGILAYHDYLRMEISVCSGFARGQLEAPLSRRHLDEWEQALGALEAGQDIQWMDDGRNAEIQVEPADDAPCVDVVVTDPVESLSSIRVTVCLPDDWLTDRRCCSISPSTDRPQHAEHTPLNARVHGLPWRRPALDGRYAPRPASASGASGPGKPSGHAAAPAPAVLVACPIQRPTGVMTVKDDQHARCLNSKRSRSTAWRSRAGTIPKPRDTRCLRLGHGSARPTLPHDPSSAQCPAPPSRSVHTEHRSPAGSAARPANCAAPTDQKVGGSSPFGRTPHQGRDLRKRGLRP